MASHGLTKNPGTAVIAALIGLGFLALGLFLPAQQMLFHQSDATAVAEVIDIRESCSSRRYCYRHPVVRFRDANGREVEAEARYSSTDDPPSVGSTVRVNYSTEDPTLVQVADRQESNYVVAAVCLAVGLLLVVVYGRQARRVLAERG